MENNYCPHCGKPTKDDDKSKEAMIDELMESFKGEDSGKKAEKPQQKKASK
jgi:hypothetical protein